ncbi:MAG: metallophosphoesterase family protein [Verrucomicrobiota bacterium]
MPFTFVHAADIHLDSPMEGLTADANQAPAVANAAREATFAALDRIVQTCIDENADFLLLAGDVYDREYRSARAQLHLHDALSKLAEHDIRTFMVHGNHDPAAGSLGALDWPDKVVVFGSEDVETREFQTAGGDAVTVSGISYRSADERRKLYRLFKPPASRGYHIALLHCSLTSHQGRQTYCECKLENLIERGFDYWALGHVHTRAILSDQPPCVVYPGNPQGREIRETGARGCMVVRANAAERDTQIEFHELDAVRWAKDDVPLDGIETLDQAERRLLQQCECLRAKAEHSVICRLRLTGRTPLFHQLCKTETLRDLLNRARERMAHEQPFVWVEKIDAAVRPPTDLAERAQEEDLLGEVLRYARSLEETGTHPQALSQACAELLDHTRMSRAIDPPDDEEWSDILDQARMLCVDLLEREQPE